MKKKIMKTNHEIKNGVVFAVELQKMRTKWNFSYF